MKSPKIPDMSRNLGRNLGGQITQRPRPSIPWWCLTPLNLGGAKAGQGDGMGQAAPSQGI